MNKYKWILLIAFILILTWSGIHPPAGNPDWLLENSPIFGAILVFVALARFIKMSDFSYTLLFIYLLFPLATSHYGVTGVPFGSTISHFFGFSRNMYDRLTHFLFGFLLFYPIYDLVLNITKKENGWSYYFPIEIIISLSAIYEIFEWLAAITVNPVLGAAFYGSQGDPFDTPEDMACALVGGILAMIIVFYFKKYKKSYSNKNLV
jgi:putative membrane protein